MTTFFKPPDETTLMPNSFIDANGTVFEWKVELCRFLSSNNAGFYRDLFDEGIIAALARWFDCRNAPDFLIGDFSLGSISANWF